MIKVENLCRNYGKFSAVKSVSFSIESGEIVGLLGHNGAGKTTIMKMLMGYLEPSSGTIEINGQPLEDHLTQSRHLIGYLPETPPVYPEMLVADYLDYAAVLRGVPKNQKAAAIKEAIQKTELQSKALHPIGTLSRGYRQRVGVAQAIINRPKILILDEPTNGLDPSQIQHMRNLIRNLGQDCTVILSTHILQEVSAVCDRALIIRHGELALDSKLCDLKKSSRLLLTTNKPQQDIKALLQPMKALSLADCKPIDNSRFQYIIEVNTRNDVYLAAADVAKAIINSGFTLYAITPESRDIETIFAEINHPSLTHPTKEVAHAA